MMIFSNGVLRDATKEEIEMFEAMEKSAQSYYQQLTKEPTSDERIAAEGAAEEQDIPAEEALDIIIGGDGV